jgi:transposase-like protein
MPGRVFNRDFKLEIARQLERGDKRVAQVCREHNLAESQVCRWRREYKVRGEQAFSPENPSQLSGVEKLEHRVAELERHCGQLSLENALLKKLANTLRSPKDTP